MADPKHLARLKLGVRAWNAWRRKSKTRPDLSKAWLTDCDLRGINLSGADLRQTNFRQSILSGANLTRADLRQADLRATSLRRAKLDHANLSGAVLRLASLVEASLQDASLTGCEIYGIAAWNLRGVPQDQSNLLLRANRDEPGVRVDDLEVAQMLYLLLQNDKLRSIVDTVGKRAVLLLGRFSAERKPVLEAIRDELRARHYVPILFDFQKPVQRDLTETVVTLAHLSRFIIADLTDPKSVPHELSAIIPGLPSVPVVPIVLDTQKSYAMFEHWKRFDWVLPLVKYKSIEHLSLRLQRSVIDRAERKARRQTGA